MTIITIFLLLIIIDALFYGFGAAVRNLNEAEVERKAEEEQNKKAQRLLIFIRKPKQFVNTVQFSGTLIHFVIGKYLITEVWVLFVALYALLTFGILFPKSLAARHPEKWAYTLVNFMNVVLNILTPFTWLISMSAKLVLWLVGGNPSEESSDVTEEEIISMVNEGHELGVIQASEVEMITNIFEYGDKEAQDIMTHRSNIVAVEDHMTLNEAVSFMLSERNSRYPVFHENIDHIIGILHLKDALRMQAKNQYNEIPIKDIEGLLREAVFIPETKNIDVLFKRMQSLKLQMVIVVDEYGQTMGLVAMEDILEEIVGNILDEYDEEEHHIKETGVNEYIIEGKTLLEDLEDKLHISFGDSEFETLNGFLISQLDRIPEENEVFDMDYGGYNFKILSVKDKMIHTVLVTKLPETALEDKV